MIQLNNETLRECYWYLMHFPTGLLSDIDSIHPDAVDYLIQNNYITCGVNPNSIQAYTITDYGRETCCIMYNTLTSNLIYDELHKN